MDKIKEFNSSLSHSFNVNERKNIVVSGIVKIESFDSEEFIIETVQGLMHIKGENLEVVKLDTYQGNISIRGKINDVSYIEETVKEGSFLSRLLK